MRVRRTWERRRRGVDAQLEKSSISLFKMIPSGVITVEPQNKLIAICELLSLSMVSLAARTWGKQAYL